MTFAYQQFFPYDEPREQQDDAIDFTLDAFLVHGKRFVILELATGVGKSGVAIAVARYLHSLRKDGVRMPLWKDMPEANEKPALAPGAYFITTQKALQQQYVTDFGQKRGCLRSIKSSANYGCEFFEDQTCGESLRMVKHESKGTPFWNKCVLNCCYKLAKQAFIDSPEGVTNFPYFLAETSYAGKLKPRELLVIDEAHNTEAQLSAFIEVTFSEHFALQVLRVKMPDIRTAPQALKWIKKEYLPALADHMEHVKQLCQKYKAVAAKLKELSSHAKQYDMMDKHLCKIHRFLDVYTADNWVLNLVDADGRSMRKIEFKPVDVAPFAESSLFKLGERVLLMSATILNKEAFCESLGIDPDEAAFISVGSPFPKEHRPIFHVPVGSLARASLDESLPHLTKAVKGIMDLHPNEKGIIHCHTYRIANYLKRTLRSRRVIMHNSEDREERLQEHIDSKKPTVLLSPSMTEGIDLKDDRARFQIICKTAYPYLGDKVIRKRMHKHKWWYPYATAKAMIQAYGRCVRSMDDHAITYILDSDFKHFFHRNPQFFPATFQEAIEW